MAIRPCAYCGTEVNPSRPGAYREVVGWTMARSAGGANKIGKQRETGRYMHGICYDRYASGISADQGAML